MSVRPKPVSDHFAADFLAVLLAQEEQVGRVEHPHAAVTDRHAGGDVQPFGEDGDLVRAAVARPCLRESSRDRDPTPAGLRGYSMLSVIQMRPRSSKVIAMGLTMSGSLATSSTREALGHRHLAEGFLRRVRLVRRLVLPMRDEVGSFGGEQIRRRRRRGAMRHTESSWSSP